MYMNLLRIFHLILMQRYKWESVCSACVKVIGFVCLNIPSFVNMVNRSKSPEAFSGKNVLKICSKFTVEHPCPNVM